MIYVTDAGHRFEIHVDGALAGFTDYWEDGDVRIFPHTEIDQTFLGRGLATTLIREALDATRAAGRSVQPACRFVRGFIVKNPEYADLVPADRRAALGLV
ncbi:MAG: GNAT family N-acetyltransferase [Candidatus Nanopelagicales bacterium]